jgi:xanthine dehydrogenase accessory factor
MTREIFNNILQLLKDDRPCVIATVVDARGSAPRHIGAKMLVFGDGAISGTIGGGSLEKRVIREALDVLKRKKSVLKDYSLNKKDGFQVCGGRVKIFLDVLVPEQTLLICGGGHIGLALSCIAKLMHWRVVLLDNRRDFANDQRFPHADKIVCGAYGRSLSAFASDANTSIVILTHGHAHDEECLEAALKTKACYIGMIGSRTKSKFIFDSLKKKGISQKRLKVVRTPIGLDIGAESPEEIAVAIAAELIKEKKKNI